MKIYEVSFVKQEFNEDGSPITNKANGPASSSAQTYLVRSEKAHQAVDKAWKKFNEDGKLLAEGSGWRVQENHFAGEGDFID